VLFPIASASYEECCAHVRAALIEKSGVAATVNAWRQGRSLSREDAIALGLELAENHRSRVRQLAAEYAAEEAKLSDVP
jgi:hypothetical protein